MSLMNKYKTFTDIPTRNKESFFDYYIKVIIVA